MKFIKKRRISKISTFSKLQQEEIYLTINHYYDKKYPIKLVCEILDIPRSSYYKWKKREIPKKELLDQQLCELIREYDVKFNHILGYRRMTLYINHFNQTNYSINYIHRLMKKLNIKSKIRRARPGYHKSTPETVADNKLNREFKASKSNEKWLTDVTKFKIIGMKNKLYLSAIYDLYDNSIVLYPIY